MASGISIREFARRDGCDDKLVRRALKSGHLCAFEDGTLDPSLVGTGWRKANRQASAKDAELSAPVRAADIISGAAGETPAQVAERIIQAAGATMSQAEAERVKENYLALLRQLEYDIKSGAVVEVAKVAKLFGTACAKVRTKLLAIPAEQAPAIHRCATVAEVQDLLAQIITDALEELTRDHGAGDEGI